MYAPVGIYQPLHGDKMAEHVSVKCIQHVDYIFRQLTFTSQTNPLHSSQIHGILFKKWNGATFSIRYTVSGCSEICQNVKGNSCLLSLLR